MEILIFPALAFAPGIFWAWFFVRRDIYRPEPKRLVALTFFLGMVATIPAGIVNEIFVDDSILSGNANLTSVAMSMLFVVGPIEELSKFMAVRLVAYKSLYFDEPGDGLVYSSAASLGFASLENLSYVFAFGPAVMLGRAPLSTLAHVIFGTFWGRALGLRAQKSSRGLTPIVLSIGLAAAVHGLFNVAVFTFPLLGVAIVIAGGIWTVRQFNWAQRVSPFRYSRNYPKVVCSTCTQHISSASQFCRYCGAGIGNLHTSLFCSHCGTENKVDALFCVKCGDQLLVSG